MSKPDPAVQDVWANCSVQEKRTVQRVYFKQLDTHSQFCDETVNVIVLLL